MARGEGPGQLGHYSEAGDDWSGDVGVLFSFLNDRLGFGADYLLAGENETARGYIRWSFGR